MAKSNIFRNFFGYDSSTDSKGVSKVRTTSFNSREFSGAITENLQQVLSGRLFRLGRTISYFLSHVPAKSYGSASLSFGLVTLFLHFIGLYPYKYLSTAIIGVLFALLSVPFLFGEKPLPLFLQDNFVTDYVFFEFFCIKRLNRMEGEIRFPTVVAVLAGALVSLLGFVFPIWQIVAIIGAVTFVYLAFLSPEFVFFASLLSLPFASYIPYSSIIICSVIGIATVSFLRKVFFGKRVLCLERYDLLLGLMTGMILISGIFVKGIESFTWSIEMAVLALGYLLASNIVTNRRLADRAVNSIVISSLPPSVYAIYQFVTACIRGNAGELIDKGVSSTFENGSVFSVFLVVAIVSSVAMLRQTHKMKKIVYFVVFVLDVVALALTGELFALLSLLLGIFAYHAFKTKKFATILLPVLLLTPYLIFLLPENLLDRVFSLIPSLASFGELAEVFRASIRAFLDNIFVGIGIGADSFAAEMSKFGIYGSTDCSNLFLELGLEAGVFAVMFFVLLLVTRLGHRANYYPFVKNSQVSNLSAMIGMCLFCLLTYGAVNYIWADMSAYYLFWCVFGIGSATLRVAKKEYDDRILYYEDTRASDSSALDVEIR